MSICNICGGNSFASGPNGRLSKLGSLPRCEKCQSLERHRAFRDIADKLRSRFDFSEMSALQFSKDLSFQPIWFRNHLLSIYGGANSFDLQNINLPNDAFDFIICNHVIEHIADDRSGLKELLRIVTSSGIIFLSFPDPLGRAKTQDWGFPDENKHGHYRVYGADAVDKFKDILSEVYFLNGYGIDYVTNSREGVWLLTKSKSTYNQILESGFNLLD